MRLTVVGCSGSLPGPTSAASCYLVEADDVTGRRWRVLLDLGSGALGPLQRYVEPADIDAVLLSHLHPDHFLDLCGLYVALRYGPRKRASPVAVHGPAGTQARVALAYAGDVSGLGAELAFTTWADGVPRRIGPLTVTPHRTQHPVESYALRVEHAGRVLTYSGDTDACPGLLAAGREAHLMLCEAGFTDTADAPRGVHLTGRRAGQAAAEAGVDRLLLTHVPPWNDPAEVLADAASVWGGPIQLAEPGLVVEL